MMGGKVKGLRISLRFHRGNGPKKQAMKNPAGGPGFSGEGISFLMGCSKNYIRYWGGYIYYNSMRLGKSVHKHANL